MFFIVMTFVLILLGILSYVVGAVKLARYGFRISRGTGLGVLLFPPYTFYFAFYELEQDGKEWPTTFWAFGGISTIVLIALFFQPLAMVMTGRTDELLKPSGVEAAIEKYGIEEVEEEAEEAPKAAPQVDPISDTTGEGAVAIPGTTPDVANPGTTPPAAEPGTTPPVADPGTTPPAAEPGATP